MLAPRTFRPLLFAVVAACGLVGMGNPTLAGGCNTCQQSCNECPPNDCGCPCYCPSSKPNNYVYKALDKVAGGIEKLLGLDKVHCDSCCDEVGCDECCDDGCDAGNLQSMPIYQTPSINPPVHRPQAPPASIVPYIDPYQSEGHADPVPMPPDLDQQQDHQWLGEPQPSSDAPFRAPPAIEPEVIRPEAMEPRVIDPPIRQLQPLTNPFQDDAKVTKKPMLRPVTHEQSEDESNPETSQKKNAKRRYSRSYSPSKRLVRRLK